MRNIVFLGCMLNLVAPVWAVQDNLTNIRSGFVKTSDGIQLHYLEAGDGPAIVFVPGWTGAAEFWEPQLRHFARSHRAVAIDPRSQGESSKTGEGNFRERRAQDIKEVIDELRLGPVVLVGWSMAAGEVLSLVDQFGTAGLRAVVLVDGTITPVQTPQAFAAVANDINEMQLNRKQYVERQARTMFKRPHSEGFYQRIITANLKTPTDTAAVLWLSQRMRDYRATLRKVDRPIMFLSQDEPGRLRQADIVREEVPTARIEVFKESGHALFLDDPERFNAVLEDFLRSSAR